MAMAGLIVTSASMMTACTAADSEPVIAERTSSDSGETGPGIQVTENNKDGRQESVEQGQTGLNQQSLSQQVEAPERYQTEMKSQYLKISADVPVTVPDVRSIPVRTVEKGEPYTDSVFEHFKTVIGEAEGINWAENKFVREMNGGYTCCESMDGVYYFSYRSGADMEGETRRESHMIWIVNKHVNVGSSADYDANDLSGMNLSPQEQERIEKQMLTKAENLLNQLDLEDFQLTDSRWKQILKYDNKWKPDGRYGVVMRFARTVDGILEPVNRASALGMAADGAQYVDITYANDGELLEFKNINREKYGEAAEESGFLLPFEAIAQIFQQYCRNAYETNPPTYILQPEDRVQPGQEGEGTTALVHMTLSGVKLEYMPVYEYDQNGNAVSPGKIVPVWNFYGGMTVGFREESGDGNARANLTPEPDMLLLSVDARDGKVYGRYMGGEESTRPMPQRGQSL